MIRAKAIFICMLLVCSHTLQSQGYVNILQDIWAKSHAAGAWRNEHLLARLEWQKEAGLTRWQAEFVVPLKLDPVSAMAGSGLSQITALLQGELQARFFRKTGTGGSFSLASSIQAQFDGSTAIFLVQPGVVLHATQALTNKIASDVAMSLANGRLESSQLEGHRARQSFLSELVRVIGTARMQATKLQWLEAELEYSRLASDYYAELFRLGKGKELDVLQYKRQQRVSERNLAAASTDLLATEAVLQTRYGLSPDTGAGWDVVALFTELAARLDATQVLQGAKEELQRRKDNEQYEQLLEQNGWYQSLAPTLSVQGLGHAPITWPLADLSAGSNGTITAKTSFSLALQWALPDRKTVALQEDSFASRTVQRQLDYQRALEELQDTEAELALQVKQARTNEIEIHTSLEDSKDILEAYKILFEQGQIDQLEWLDAVRMHANEVYEYQTMAWDLVFKQAELLALLGVF